MSIKNLAALLFCAGLGGLAMQYLTRGSERQLLLFAAASPPVEWEREASNSPSPSTFVGAQVSALLAVEDLTDVAVVERAIEEVLKGDDSPLQREMRIEALLLRLVEIAPQQALRLAVKMSIDRDSIATMFRIWASVDSAQALDEFARVPDAALRRYLANELATVLEPPERILELASIGGFVNSKGFMVDALSHLASMDPVTALGLAEGITADAIQTETYLRIAEQWARFDGEAALNYLERIRNPLLRNRFHAAIVSEWIRADAASALDYLESSEGARFLGVLPLEARSAFATSLALYHPPESLIAASDAMSIGFGRELRTAALRQLINRDLSDALARLESMPDGRERMEFSLLISKSFARKDPEGALQWARRLSGTVAPLALRIAIAEIGRSDPIAAADAAIAHGIVYAPSPQQLSELTPQQLLGLVDKYARGGQVQLQSIDELTRSWAGRDSTSMWNWLIGQGPSANPRVVRSAAKGLAMAGVVLSAQTIYQLPEQFRESFVVQFAGDLTLAEPEKGIDWLRQFQDQPDYDNWATAVATFLAKPGARGNPAAQLLSAPAAEILDTMRDSPPRDLVASVAAHWATADPTEATRWVLRIRDPELRTTGAAAAVSGWAVSSPDSARQWALSLPAGEMRARVLMVYLAQEIASHGSISRRVVDAFGTGADFQAAVNSNRKVIATAITWLGSRNLAAANAILEEHIKDAGLRSDIQLRLDGARQGGREVHKDTILDSVF